LKIYIYGYLNRVQSSRRLERECQRNVELVWLTGRLMPDFKTIADFRKDNGEAIRKVCRAFVLLCRRLDLLSGARVAIDGSKFKAVNARERNFTETKMKRRLEQLDESIARYLSQLDAADRQGPTVPEAKTTRLTEKIATLREEIERLNALNARMMASEDKQISLTDPDARAMATSGKGSGIVGYNVQSAVDTTHHLIVAHEVTNVGTDRSQLSNMAAQARTEFRTATLDVVADRGYYDGQEILACETVGITVTLAAADDFERQGRGPLRQAGLRLRPAEDVYRCPAGERLIYRYTNEEDGKTLRRYWTAACQTCALEGSVHTGQGAPDLAVGARDRSRNGAGPARPQPGQDAGAPPDRGASVRDHQGVDGRHALPDEKIAESDERNGAARAGLRHQARDADSGRWRIDRRHPCLRRVLTRPNQPV
jgi:Transposase domain (DUF772)